MKNVRYDIVVVGGGCAGVAAALEAARGGYRTALVEKTLLWGGLVTSGLVTVYMPLCDGRGTQVTYGIAEELLRASLKYGYGRIPRNWDPDQTPIDEKLAFSNLWEGSGLRTRYQCRFNPGAFVMAMDELLEEAGVDRWVDTLFCAPVMRGNAVTGVEVENKGGRVRIDAGCFIDATGDGDLAFRAGAPVKMEKGSLPYYMHHTASLENAEKCAGTGFAGNLMGSSGVGANEWGKGYDGDLPVLNGLDGRDVSTFVLEGRKLARLQLAEKQRALGADGRERYYPTTLPTMAQYRMTRMIDCHGTVGDDPNRYEDDSIGMVADCRQRAAVWEVPYGSLVPRKVKNLLVAGRCGSAEEYSWHVTRLIQGVALTGQACGAAAGLAVENGTSPDALEAEDVQEVMAAHGIPLHYDVPDDSVRKRQPALVAEDDA